MIGGATNAVQLPITPGIIGDVVKEITVGCPGHSKMLAAERALLMRRGRRCWYNYQGARTPRDK